MMSATDSLIEPSLSYDALNEWQTSAEDAGKLAAEYIQAALNGESQYPESIRIGGSPTKILRLSLMPSEEYGTIQLRLALSSQEGREERDHAVFVIEEKVKGNSTFWDIMHREGPRIGEKMLDVIESCAQETAKKRNRAIHLQATVQQLPVMNFFKSQGFVPASDEDANMIMELEYFNQTRINSIDTNFHRSELYQTLVWQAGRTNTRPDADAKRRSFVCDGDTISVGRLGFMAPQAAFDRLAQLKMGDHEFTQVIENRALTCVLRKAVVPNNDDLYQHFRNQLRKYTLGQP